MKPSHLTRSVFRAILANRPYTVTGCQHRAWRNCFLSAKQCSGPRIYRRSLFTALLGTVNLQFEGAKVTPKNLELALGKLVDLIRARRTNSRTPPDDELLGAFKFIFAARLEARRRLTRNEIFLVTETFKHFQDRQLVINSSLQHSLEERDLNLILSTLALPAQREQFRSDATALATLVFQSLPSKSTELQAVQSSAKSLPLLATYISVLAKTGSAIEARRLLVGSQDPLVRNNARAWIDVMEGLVNESREKELIDALRELSNLHSALTASDYERIISFLATHRRLKETREYYDLQIANQKDPSTQELRQLLEMLAVSEDINFATRIMTVLMQRIADPEALGALLIWQTVQEKSAKIIVDKVDRFIHGVHLRDLSIEPFSILYRFGLRQNKPEIMNAACNLAEMFDVRPDGKMYALQMKNALNKEDITQASLIYEQMVHQDTPADDSDLPILNKFLAKLAFLPQTPYTLIIRVVDTILERNADFTADALAGLCRVFLQRDELEDATGMLRHRADFYPEVDRARIAAVFKDFILDPLVSDQRAYNAYEIFRHAFPETPVDQKMTIMQSFFDRKRSDLACTVFTHVRQREDLDARPTPEAYAQCFAGIAQCRDIDGLQIINNMLKLDLEVEPTTRIRNGLMLAYIACNLPFTAMIDNFWKVLDSPEGPTYSTFEIGLRACETWVPQGGYEARKIIAIMQAWNLEITKDLYDNYIGAIAGQSEFEYAVELIEEMEKDIGERPDAITIGTFYNAIPWQYRKDEVEKWAKEAYPDLWADLIEYGDEIDEEWEIRFFKIPRDIDINDEPLFATGTYDPLLSRKVVQALEPPTS